MKMAWKLENMRKDPNSKESYADLFISQIKEEPKTACLFTIGDARAVEIILEKYKNTQFVVFDYPALIKFLDFAKPANLFKAIPIKYDWESESEFLGFVEAEMQKASREIEGTNMSSFDLIIANPPYGKSSSLSKKIVNALLENKVAEEYVVLAPPRSFLDTLDKIVDFENKGLTSDLFDIPAANGIRVYCTKYTNNEINRYSEFDLRFYDKKLKQLADAVHRYNKEHETFIDTDYEYGGLSWKTLNYLSTEIKKGLDPSRIFLIPYFTPRNGVQWGECGDHNNGVKLWDFEKGKSSALAIVLKENYKKYFNEYFYKYYKDKERRVNGLLNQFLMCIRLGWSDSPGVEAYLEYFPNLDWSHPWTDEEILAELGLPEDFLEE